MTGRDCVAVSDCVVIPIGCVEGSKPGMDTSMGVMSIRNTFFA